jgi:RHS repeat-associated protein
MESTGRRQRPKNNNAGQIKYTVPPKATALIAANGYHDLTSTAVNNLVFKYTYDARGRSITKTIPGKGVMNVVYDPLNRPVLMQDANLSIKHQWAYTSYDVKGRVASSGIYSNTTIITQADMQAHLDGMASSYATLWYESRGSDSTKGYYTQQVFPIANITPLNYAYYDNYDLNHNGTPDFVYSVKGLPNEDSVTTAPLKGMATMMRQTTIGSGIAAGKWLTKVVFYDKRGNTIQTQSSNHINGGGKALSDYSTTVPNFMGVAQVTLVSKKTGTHTITVKTVPAYDHAYRVLAVTQQYNSLTPVLVATYSYNEIGQLVNKGLGGTATAPLQSVDYLYNIRGQVLSINNSKLSTGDNELFGMELLYDVGNSNVDNTPSYTGNLTGIKWMTRDTLGNKGVERSYHYNYDNVNRFTGAYYGERPTAGTGTFTDNPGGFSENGLSYDQNGNIQTLYRYSSTPGGSSRTAIDSLAYTYNTNDANQLLKVTDATGNNLGFGNFTGSTGSYAYDTEGNLTSDPYKGINITYDVLNKTDTVKLAINKYMTYTYDAGGNLLRKQQTSGSTVSTTDYIDGFVYINTLLAYFPSPEGRVLSTGSTTVQSQYTITDPQGNARVSFVDNGSGTARIVQEDSYYATGLIMQNSNVNTPPVPNKNLYNGGSEWQNDFSNLPDYYETFYRNYDPAIARFNAIDPVADATESMSTYQYANDNPVMGNDPMGNFSVRQAGKSRQNENPSWTIFRIADMTGWLGMPMDSGQGLEGGNAGPGDDNVTGDYSIQTDAQLIAEAKNGDAGALDEWTSRYGNNVYNEDGSDNTTNTTSNSYFFDENGNYQQTLQGDDPQVTYQKLVYTTDQYGTNVGSYVQLNAAQGIALLLANGMPIDGDQGGDGWYDTASKLNYGAGLVTEGMSDLGKSGGSIMKIGELGGKGLIGVGILFDGIGVYNYYHKGPNNPNSVSPGKASLNTAVAIYGIWDPPVAIGYGSIDLFYPEGWPGYINDNANRVIQNNDHTPFYYLSGDPMQGGGAGTY